jgi:molybdenum cofactor synthesis domain-containing protein
MALLPLDEARSFVISLCQALPPVAVPLADAAGCVLAEAVVSDQDLSPFANTAMDGFAVRAADTAELSADNPGLLRVVGTITAGMAPAVEVGPGEAVRIMTGAPMPTGADAVVIVEATETVDDHTVEIRTSVPPGLHVRPAGDDLQVGQAVFDAGTVLGPGHIGVLASLGRTMVTVVPRPRVGVVSTGDELVQGDAPLAAGQIRDSNRPTLLAMVRALGAEAIDLGHVADDDGAIEAVLRRGADRCDAVVSSGGVSMGDVDLVKVVLDRIGDMRWMQVAIRPAKPLAAGTLTAADGRVVPVFGLPGNPVSSQVSFELFARPGVRTLAGFGADQLDRPRVSAVTDHELSRRPDGKTHFVRVICTWKPADGRYHVRSAGPQGSHQLTAMAHANALVVLGDGAGVAAGDSVPVVLLG